MRGAPGHTPAGAPRERVATHGRRAAARPPSNQGDCPLASLLPVMLITELREPSRQTENGSPQGLFMSDTQDSRGSSRCQRCGYEIQPQDKFCAQCGAFLRDAYVDHRLLLALVHEREGRGNEARQELERLLLSEPDHVLANHLLGNLCFHEGVLLEAIRYYERALAHAPAFARGYYDLGVAWYHHGDMPEAITAFEQCLKMDPHYNAAHYRLAVCYFHAGRLEEALQQFESSLTLTPEYLMAHYHIGVIHERRGAYGAAEHAFERSQEEGVGEVSSLFHLAAILRTRGDERGARELLERAREFAQAKALAD